MNKKSNQKQYRSSVALYERLKQVLKAERVQSTVEIKQKNVKREIGHKRTQNSQSVGLNDVLLHGGSSGMGFEMVDDKGKQEEGRIKQQKQREGMEQLAVGSKRKRVPYFQVFKGKNRHLMSVKESRLKRMNNFFSSKQAKYKTQHSEQQNDENLAHSLILKAVNQNVPQENSLQSFTENLHISANNQNMQSHENASGSNRVIEGSQIYLNNQSLRKGHSHSVSSQSRMIKKFPELEILNQNNFTSSKRNLFKRLNTNSVFGSMQNKELVIGNDMINIKQCRNEEHHQKQPNLNKQKLLQPKQTNFQYFVYEYKTLGQKASMIEGKSVSVRGKNKLRTQRQNLQSATFLRSKQSVIHQNSQRLQISNVKTCEMFHNFIYKNKQIDSEVSCSRPSTQERPRAMTANVKLRERRDVTSDKIIAVNECKSMGMKTGGAIKGEQNFVKPWQSSHQGEVGF